MNRAQRIWKVSIRSLLLSVTCALIGIFTPIVWDDIRIGLVVVQLLLVLGSFLGVRKIKKIVNEPNKTHGLKIDMHVEAEVAHDSDAVWNPSGQTSYTAVVNKDNVVVAMFINRVDAYKYIAMLEAQ